MARFRKMRIDTEAAKSMLGQQWLLVDDTKRPIAELPKADEDLNDSDVLDTGGCRRKLCTWPEMSDGNTTLKKHGIVFEMLWPRRWQCTVDLADFYWNNKTEPQHPLNGFRIPELVEATGLPFHFPERVRVIPIQFNKDMACIKVGTDTPDGVIFVECWSHLDKYDRPKYRDNAYDAFSFKTYLYHGMLENYTFENKELCIGCNFIILPMGYEYVAELENCIRVGSYPKREKIYAKNIPRWRKILKEFFDGNGENAEVTTSQTPMALVTDEAVAEALADFDDTSNSDDADTDLAKDPVFAQWIQDGRTKWRDQFWSDLVHNIVMNCEVCLVETDYGVQLYTIADADAKQAEHSECLNRHFEMVGEVWYQVEDFTYCQKHYLAFLKRLSQLQSEGSQTSKEIRALHEAFTKAQGTTKGK